MERFFEVALKEANKAKSKNEVPVGAVLVKKGKIIAKSYNNRQKKHRFFGHAEINCILRAEKRIKDWRLDDCELYVTLEPCEMCKVFIKESRIKTVYYLLSQKKCEKIEKNVEFIQTNDCDKLQKEYENTLNDFFQKLRNKS